MEPVALVALAILVVGGTLASAAIHIVPAGRHAVVMRAGVPVRSRATGFIHTIPCVERVRMIATHPPPLDPLAVHALTRDGVELQLVASVLYRVTDPDRVAQSATDVRTATKEALERAMHHQVAEVDLVTLLRDRESELERLADASSSLLDPLGVTLLDIDLLSVEVRVGAQLLGLLES